MLLDGLDEVADLRKRARVVEAVVTFTRHYQGNRFVVTSRPRGYEGEAQHQLATLYASGAIRDFDDADMTAFAHNWYAAVIRDRMGDTPDAKAEAQRQANDLLRAIRADQRVLALAHNPLLLSVLAMVHQRGVGLPQRRAELYDECTVMLLGYWDQTKGGEAARELAAHGSLSRGEKRALLEPIALWFHERGEHSPEATQEELKQEVARQFMDILGDDEETAHSHATLFLRVVDERAGLLVQRETGIYAFAHLTFQEYLAARAIADRDDYIAYTLQRLHVPWWREVLLLEAGHLSDVRHFGRRARKLTSDLIRAIRNADSWLEDVLQRDLLFAVRCLCDTGKLGVDDVLRTSLLDALIALWRTTPYEPQRQEIDALFAYAMPTLDGDRIHEELLRCLDDPNMRRAAVEALGRLGAAAATPATLEPCLDLLADTDPDVRWTAEEALGELGAAAATPATLEHLLALTADANSNVRQAATMTLGWLGAAAATPATLERLLALTADPDRDVREAAALTLGGLGTETAAPAILERLLTLTADADASVRQATAVALGKLGVTPATVERLLALMIDADREVRRAAVWALGWLGTAAATPATLERLLALAADANDDVRQVAAVALGRLGAEAATPATGERLLALTTDASRDVRWAAAVALGSMADTTDLLEHLAQFWRGYLTNFESERIDDQYSVCYIAYWQLQQLAAQHAAKIESSKETMGSGYLTANS